MDTAAADRDDAAMTTPRRLLVDPVNACDYHLVSRCVQGAFLCGRDPRRGRDYSHRRQWLVDRIRLLACCFAVKAYAYYIMSNHFHLVARYDPLACWRWSDEEVMRRWIDALPPTEKKRPGDTHQKLTPTSQARLETQPAGTNGRIGARVVAAVSVAAESLCAFGNSKAGCGLRVTCSE